MSLRGDPADIDAVRTSAPMSRAPRARIDSGVQATTGHDATRGDTGATCLTKADRAGNVVARRRSAQRRSDTNSESTISAYASSAAPTRTFTTAPSASPPPRSSATGNVTIAVRTTPSITSRVATTIRS
jgi:hypothetical protein